MSTQEPKSRTTGRSRAPAAERALKILELIAESDEPLGVNVIARELDIVPSTCFHILRALEQDDYVAFNEKTKKYHIGLGCIRIARHALRQVIPLQIVQEGLNSISNEFGVTTLAVRIDSRDQMVVVAVSRGEAPVSVYVELGLRVPAFHSATGRCYAAHSGLSREELKKRFDKLHWADPPSFKDWMKQVDQARLEGYGMDRGNNVPGFTFVAVPVFSDRGMTGAISAVFAGGQEARLIESGLLDRLRELSAKIS